MPPSKVRLKRNVDIERVKQERLPSFVETVGTLDAEGQTDIAAGVSGLVTDVFFREGDLVIKDQTLLARIDPTKYRALLKQAEANLEKARANVLRTEAMQKKFDAAIRDAQQTLELRRVVLDNIRRAGRSIKIEERQEAQAMVEMTSARLEVAKAEKSISEADLDAARNEVAAAMAAYDLAKRNFELSEVRAPYTGQINQRKITRGTYLEDKTIIATMADLSRLRLVGYIPERSAPLVRDMLQTEQRIQSGFLVGGTLAGPWSALAVSHLAQIGETPAVYRLEFTLRPFPNQTFHGRIFYLSTVANPDTHLFECKAEVPTTGVGTQLRPGFSAKIRCPLPGRPSSIIVPEVAVRASERGFVAFRPRAVPGKDGTTDYVAEAVPLDLGQRQPGWVEVLKGLAPGDVVITKGAEALEDGTPLALPKDKVSLTISPR
ncbi:MAG: efflux RND transporter periplasmic adaptor subunit [Gemmataceae bacterium]